MSNRAPRKWYEAPWFWITGGCCLGCLIVPLACIGIAGTGGFLALTKNPLMGQAMETARNDPTLIEELGTPIEHRLLAGSNNLNINNRNASLTITVGGPNGTAQVSGDAQRRGGVWDFHQLDARLEDGRTVNLLTGELRPPSETYEMLPLGEDEELEDAAEAVSDSSDPP